MVREPEWTDDDRRQMLELEAFESGVHKCGYHVSLLNDKTNLFTADIWTCPVCEGAAREAKRLRRKDDLHRDKEDPYAPDPADGRDVRMRMLSPTEAEEYRLSLAEKAPGQQPEPADEPDGNE